MKTIKNKTAPHLALAVGIAVGIVFILSHIWLGAEGRKLPTGVIEISSGWLIKNPDGTVTEPDYEEKRLQKNETLDVCFYAPSIYGAENESICFVSQGTAFQVYDSYGEEIYSYGIDLMEQGKMVPRKLHFIKLPKEMERHYITMSFVAVQKGARVRLRSAYYGDAEKLESIYFKRKAFAFLCGLFFLSFGALLVCLQLFFRDFFQNLHGTFFQGMLLVTIGLYSLCYNDLTGLFVNHPEMVTLIEYLALLTLPVWIQYCIILNNDEDTGKVHRQILKLQMALSALCLILHFTGIVQINALGFLIHAVLGVWAIYSVIWLIRILRKDRGSVSAQLYANISRRCISLGLLCSIIFGLFDFISSYTVRSYGYFVNPDIRGFYFMLGGCILSAGMLLSYFFHTVGSMQEEEIRLSLEGMAYTDELTGLSNRANCDRFMTEYSMKHLPCTIFSFDLDGLKVINDTKGHQAGDEYLKSFADLLSRYFENELLLGRMGGDEFIMITRKLDVLRLDNLLFCMNQDAQEMHLQYSYGYASTEEVPGGNLGIVYMMADQRMYRMKDQHHMEKGEEKR